MKTTLSSVRRIRFSSLALAGVFAVFSASSIRAEHQAPTGKAERKVMDYDTAVAQLKTPQTWCLGAKRLAQLAERRALVPLLTAYEKPIESSKLCLLDAMEALGPTAGARELYERHQAAERRLGVHLMELFPSEEFLPVLEIAVADSDEAVRAQARHSLACQVQTPKWEALLLRLLEAADEQGRIQAIESLSRRRGEVVRKALTARLKRDPSAAVREKLEKTLRALE